MLQEIRIRNFKSISDITLQLGRVNVFIGENGSGKSNILEAIAFVSAIENGRVYIETLIEKGVRIAKPTLMTNSFFKTPQNSKIEFDLSISDIKNLNFSLVPDKENSISSNWVDLGLVNALKTLTDFYKNIKNVNINDEKSLLETLQKMLSLASTDNNKDALQGELSNFSDSLKALLFQDNNQGYQEYFSTEYNQIISNYLIYSLNTPALRGLPKFQNSNKLPVGVNGEGLDLLISNMDNEEKRVLHKYNYLINWLKDFDIDKDDKLKHQGYKLNRSKSNLYFTDKYMQSQNNTFSSENVNEGILHILFYMALIISKQTPSFFAIDNIEMALNPHLCRHLMKEISELTKEREKQILVTTHNPAILDGLNLWDDDIRLFVVKRKDNGHTDVERIKLKPEHKEKAGKQLKLSELWTRGYLGAISNRF